MTESRPAFTLLHLSDIHAGQPVFQPHVADRIVQDAARLAPTLTVISGDMVMREWTRHFEEARAFIQRLPQPQLVVPGNHDLPVFHFWETLRNPLRRFHTYISDADPFFYVPGLAVAGMNSTVPFLSAGYFRQSEMRRMAARFAGLPADTCRVVVVHHHFVPLPRRVYSSSSIVRGRRRALDAFEDAGVELVLSGHMHYSHIGNSLDFRPRARRGTILVQAGTATSRRGRLSERHKNTYNVIHVDAEHITITHYMFFAELDRFEPLSRHIFPRRLQITSYLRT